MKRLDKKAPMGGKAPGKVKEAPKLKLKFKHQYQGATDMIR